MPALPLIRHDRPEAAIAWRAGQSLTAQRFLIEVRAAASSLPSRPWVVNLCRDRYRFAVAFAAALWREQVTLLPPNDTPGVLGELAAAYPEASWLRDDSPELASVPAGEVGEPPKIPAFASDQIAALLFTSGSTGEPKPHARPWGSLVESALAAGRRMGVPALRGGTVIGTVPHQHSYGLESTVMLAWQHALALQAERPFFPGDVCARLEEVPRPRILVTTPVHLRHLLDDPGITLPRIDLLVCATAPLAPQMAAEAERRFGAPLEEIYGCSEVGQIAVRRTAASARWECIEGIALSQDEKGTWAAGAIVPARTLLQDVIDLHAPDSFDLLGRTADLVNVAGKRTSLAYLNHHLNAIDGVRDGVFLMPGDEGVVTRLMAFAVAPSVSPEAILSELRQRIDAAFLPRPLRLVTELPRNALGKLRHEDLLRLAERDG